MHTCSPAAGNGGRGALYRCSSRLTSQSRCQSHQARSSNQARGQVRSRLPSRQCRRTEAAPEFPSQTARHNALRGISDKKARGDHKELCSQSDRCVGIFGRFVQKQLGGLKPRDDHRNGQQGSDERTEQRRDQTCPLGAETVGGRPHGQRVRPAPC